MAKKRQATIEGEALGLEGQEPETETNLKDFHGPFQDSGGEIERVEEKDDFPPDPTDPKSAVKPVLVNWMERRGRARVRRETTVAEMEGLVVSEGIGSPYYVILDGKRRVLSSVAQAMGFGAVRFLRAEELAKIPEGEPA